MAITTAASRLGTSAFSDTSPVELRPNFSQSDANQVINAVYRQLLGNDYVMASERLVSAESLLRNGNITVRDFVTLVAKSELYKQKFLYNNFQTRVIELNSKHLLGRAPYDESEVIEHLDRYQNQGFDADIDSYTNSEEYINNFGDNTVPFYRGFSTQRGQKTVGFTRMFQLYRGYASSDRTGVAGKSTRLASELGRNAASSVIAPGGNGAGYLASAQGVTPKSGFGGSAMFGSEHRLYRVEVAGASLPRYPKVRRVNQDFIVPYDQLSDQMQKIQRQGGRIASVTPI
ncbi:phycobilisome linker polypeptide [Merismopedia glauca]|uniref:Photosystem I reaction center subunit XII n=1 Tax=Merismopedia glauca CCAP 1448/3 TaxID=1296344 RepID=A0A2T1C7X0_9CYAN|nr:phycobilisome linker polypeptide [Merismopedia glauca]PSB04324.1 photosystem I reaction center subunit XII [Merismopedia glauca CCAP 1448/3]